jgi:hypothetical protein
MAEKKNRSEALCMTMLESCLSNIIPYKGSVGPLSLSEISAFVSTSLSPIYIEYCRVLVLLCSHRQDLLQKLIHPKILTDGLLIEQKGTHKYVHIHMYTYILIYIHAYM